MTENDLLLVRHRRSTLRRVDALLPLIQATDSLAAATRINRATLIRLCASLGLQELERRYLPGEEVPRVH